MRKTITVLALTILLTGGAGAAAFADEAVAGPSPVAQSTEENADNQESDKTGLLGLLGLLGLAGLAKKKNNDDIDAGRRR